MSVQAIVWVLEECPDLPKHLVGTMVGLANHADQNGRGAYPSQPLLAWYARKDERSIRRDLEQAEELELIARGDQRMVLHIPADNRPVVYDLMMHRKRDPRPDARRREGRPRKVKEQVNAMPETPRTPTSAGKNTDDPGTENPPDAHVRPDAHVKTPRTPTTNRADAGVRLTALDPSKEPNPPLPPVADEPAAAVVGQAVTGEDSIPTGEPRTDGLSALVDELVAAAKWPAALTREVLEALRERNAYPPAEIARVFREVAAGKHGPTGSPRRLLSWWPTPAKTGTDEPAWARGPFRELSRDTPRCVRHPDQPRIGCNPCEGERKAAPDDQQTAGGERLAAAAARELARANALAAKTSRGPHKQRTPEPPPAAEGPDPVQAGNLFGTLTAAMGGRA